MRQSRLAASAVNTPPLPLRKLNAAVTGGQYGCRFSHRNRHHDLLL